MSRKNYTNEELTKAFEKLGIVKMIDRTESAEDPNIRFSKYDTCFISEIHYVDRVSEITRRCTRLSETFERAYQVLKEWYEIDDYYINKTKKELFPSCEYGFISECLPKITIDINNFHNNLYKIKVNYVYDSKWYEVDNLEKDLGEILNNEIEKCDNILVKREIKLRSLLC